MIAADGNKEVIGPPLYSNHRQGRSSAFALFMYPCLDKAALDDTIPHAQGMELEHCQCTCWYSIKLLLAMLVWICMQRTAVNDKLLSSAFVHGCTCPCRQLSAPAPASAGAGLAHACGWTSGLGVLPSRRSGSCRVKLVS